MKIRRPRLLVGSLVAAVALIAVVTVVLASRDDANGVDAHLRDPRAVVTYPSGGLGNTAVEGEQLPEATLTDSDGNDVDSADLLGGPLVINMWFSTCAPCAKELPEFAEVDAERDDVTFVGVNTIDSVATMERFAGDRGVTYELLRDEYAEFTDGVGAVAFPMTLFVTSDGTIVDQTGALDADELNARIDNLLKLDATT